MVPLRSLYRIPVNKKNEGSSRRFFWFLENGSLASTEANACTKASYVYLNSVGFKFLVTFLFSVFY